jgi:hypothetical protein
MATIIMSMCGDKAEHDVVSAVEYDDEVLSAGWNPVVSLQHLVTEQHAAMPHELVSVDAEQFLQKMYGSLS